MKYGQKIYIWVLVLFILCLGGGLAVFGQRTVDASFAARKDAFLYTQHQYAADVTTDLKAVQERRPEALATLAAMYQEKMLRQGFDTEIRVDGEVLCALPFAADYVVPEAGFRSWQVITVEDVHYLIAASVPVETGYTIILAQNIEDFYTEWHVTLRNLIILGGLLILIFALGLLAVLKRLNQPIRELNRTALSYTEGRYDATPARSLKRTDELGDLARTLSEMAGRVEAQMQDLQLEAEAKQSLIDDLSHEMRTPLTAIGGYASLMQQADLSEEELHSAAETIRKESSRLLHLSEQLVKLSVLRQEDVELSTVQMGEVCRFAVQTITPKADEKGVSVSASIEDQQRMGEQTLLESLVINLLDNAVKACDTGGRVELKAKVFGAAEYRITIHDDGRGMDAETLSRIGEPFYRADKARSRKEGGAGLGVALCKKITEVHGAQLFFTSKPGEGTTVQVLFGGDA